MDDLYPAIEREIRSLVDAVKAQVEGKSGPDVWMPVVRLPLPYMSGVVEIYEPWRLALEKLLEKALEKWPRPGIPFETVKPRLDALRGAAIALSCYRLYFGREGEAYLRWSAATNRIGAALREVHALAIAAGQKVESADGEVAPSKGRPGRPRYPREVLDFARKLRDENPEMTVHEIRAQCLEKFSGVEMPPNDDAFRTWMRRSNRPPSSPARCRCRAMGCLEWRYGHPFLSRMSAA
jgi:hypothetical protein